MNTKATLGILVVIGAFVIGYLYLGHSAPAPAVTPHTVASTTPQTSLPQQTVQFHTQPTFKFGTSTTTTVPAYALFDTNSLVSTSTYPTITGTANVPKVGIIVSNSEGVGIVGTADITVDKGHWSYPCSVALTPGTYILTLIGRKDDTVAILTVR